MKHISPFIFILAFAFSSLDAAFTVRNGSIVEVAEVAQFGAKEHYDIGMRAYQSEEWDEAERQFLIVITNFSPSQFPLDTYFFLGVSYYYQGEHDLGDQMLSDYLRLESNPIYLTDAIEYKFNCAEKFRLGAKRRPWGSKRLPCWLPATDRAIEIYDEVASTLPCSEIAAQALYSKGCLMCEMRDFRGSVEAFQTLVRRFPRHELAPDAYIAILQTYVIQATFEGQNPDLLAFAELTLRRFEMDFPSEERLAEAECLVGEIEEIYAWGLYSTGRFYERTKKPQASVLYYASAITQFPNTVIADTCRELLFELIEKDPCLDIPDGLL